MNVAEIYDYLVRARRDLWSVLESLPDEVLARPLLSGTDFKCLKDFVAHIPAVEDGWIHEDILRQPSIWETQEAFQSLDGQDGYAHLALATLLDYWRQVEQSTLAFLPTLTDAELKRVVTPHDAPNEQFVLDHLLWHVMLHEMRHTAQLCVLLRGLGIKPPALDLLFYLPNQAQPHGNSIG